MKDYKSLLWIAFSGTGDINEYRKYKLIERLSLNFEAGEEFGVDKDVRDSAENN